MLGCTHDVGPGTVIAATLDSLSLVCVESKPEEPLIMNPQPNRSPRACQTYGRQTAGTIRCGPTTVHNSRDQI